MERESDKSELGTICEYTAPGTPQQNGVVGRASLGVSIPMYGSLSGVSDSK